MWGQATYRFGQAVLHRIIPTRVGTSITECTIVTVWRDHPHACGDKLIYLSKRKAARGSSPRVWGQVLRFSFNQPFSRIIPTRVGTRRRNILCLSDHQDHPHACGDKAEASQCYVPLLGSSPRVWGQANEATKEAELVRIIPTRVGTSSLFRSR